jgi:ubiquilin
MMAQMYGAGGPAGGFGGFGGGGGASPAAPAGPQVSAEERYQSQLETLAGMGFVDAGRNVRALMASGGNVEGAIEWLFSN